MDSNNDTQDKTWVFLHKDGLAGRAGLRVIIGYNKRLTRSGEIFNEPINKRITFGAFHDGKYVTSDEKEAEAIRNTTAFRIGKVIELDPNNPDHNITNTRLASDEGKRELERNILIEKAKRYGMSKQELDHLKPDFDQLKERVAELQDDLAEKALAMARKSLDSVDTTHVEKPRVEKPKTITADI